MTNEIVQYQQHDMFLPVMNLEVAIQRRDQLVGFVRRIMRADHDYGKIPGTDKDVLLKPGAEKLCTFFGLAPVFVPTATIQDWSGEEHGGEPLFYYRYKCELYRSGNMIATGEGSCSSRESKYRYRKAERVCPQCGKPAIIKGSAQYGGGWLCFKKKDGCGAKFGDKDPAIIGQEVGRVFNPDVADLDNTILKMAQKRALIAAVLIGVNASEFFTQDMEDFVEDDVIDVVATKATASVSKVFADQEPPLSQDADEHLFDKDEAQKPPRASREQLNRFHAIGTQLYGAGPAWDAARHALIETATTGETTSSNDLTPGECNELMITMLGKKVFDSEWPAKVTDLCQRNGATCLRDLSQAAVNKSIDNLQKRLQPVAATGK